ncbi:hypothetical protein [Kitasatospora aureofaciens]|uniref:hypothetical protein n=1 Tax=Streptomyces phage mu1/6 TaxID=370623 RepID=UPI0000D4F6B8|nr:hypothetical protein SPMV1_gp10 [Streptomyces phage mu1/6]ABD94175.1 unknown [Streptomyces phage mu1/6]
MKPTPHHPAQLSPALALAQLLAENPTLPALYWDIRPDGELNGHLWADDTRATQAAYRQALGIDRVLTIGYSVKGVAMLGTAMSVTWRDVHVHLSFRSLASVYLAEGVAA